MRDLRVRWIVGADRVLAALLAATLVGATLAFGGLVWWATPALGVLVVAMVLVLLLRMGLEGRVRLLRSPLAALGLLAVGLAVAQLAPLPPGLAAKLSPRSRALHAEAAGLSDPTVFPGRSTVSVDRPATVRWLVGASACLAVFCVAAHFADRLGRLRVVWGSVVAAFGICTVLGVAQLLAGSSALYGLYEPGRAPAWAPSMADLQAAPGSYLLRKAGGPEGEGRVALAMPPAASAIGPLPSGPGAFLALAALALPLAVALTLQPLAPRGSREGLLARLKYEGGAARVVLLVLTVVAGSTLAGVLAGPWLALPIAFSLVLAGLPSLRGVGVALPALGLTASALVALGVGVRLGQMYGRPEGAALLTDPSRLTEVAQVWRSGVRISRDFPVLGAGFGSFGAIYPLYKTRDASETTALSALVQWVAESGVAGLALLAIGALWCLWRLPGAIGRVRAAERPLLAGLIGSALGFALFSAVHWSVQLPAVALAACAVAGTLNRWLAGGTDLFIERG